MLNINLINNREFILSFAGKTIFQHSDTSPLCYIGIGQETIDMYRGNFKINDYLEEKIALRDFKLKQLDDTYIISFYLLEQLFLELTVACIESKLIINFEAKNKSLNRFWLRVCADEDEKIYGCGEQLSYFNLRGRNFPLWSSEPGVGRDKSTYVTWQADVKDKAGGDYYTTNYPQSTFVSSQKYYLHMDSTAYMNFDFTHNNFHELHCWEIPHQIIIETADNYLSLISKLTKFFGRVQELPEWVYNGIILGIQDGPQIIEQKLSKVRQFNVKIAGVWAQDWQGERRTSFGKRLNWNWQWDKNLYPDLDKKIIEWKQQGIRFLGYINPYLIKGYPLYAEAQSLGYFATSLDGSEYLVDFGEFYCGVVDLTNPDAFKWYKQRVIGKELIEFGLDGWMADFGEYLPIDCKLYNGVSAKIMHNDWPRLWAKANFEAVQEYNKLGEILFFMRAGFNGCQPYNLLLWAGDQCVDFSLHDGLASVIPAALSSGMSGSGIHHSDIGGYTTLHGLKRTKQLFMRWVEMAAFTPVMRTHEGNRPKDNFQFDQDDEALQHLAKFVSIYVGLKSYIQDVVNQCANLGFPCQRPLFMHYEDDPQCYDLQYQYLFGEDILVAPVHQENMEEWLVYLPNDEWVHLFTKEQFIGGWHTISAPIGKPAVFYRKKSSFSQLFNNLI
ncbi:MAG: hypothetical protein RLZZ293_466 [Pseudomonadota bacterium]|jgi:alpha-glucosidase